MLNKFLSITILMLIIASLLVSCGSKNEDNNNVAEGGNSSDVGGKGEDALPGGDSNDSPSDSTDKGDETPDNVGGNDNEPDENVGGDNIPEDSDDDKLPEDNGENEKIPEDSGDGDNLPEDSGDGEQNPEENEPEVNIPFGTAVGYRFNDVQLQTLDGSLVNTAVLREKIIIFNVWATWCQPCKAELPDFNAVASEYADDVVIIAAHKYDEYAANMPSYVANNFPNTKIIFAYDNSANDAYAAAGGVGYVPQTAIIDKDGIIRYSDYGRLSYSTLISIIQDLIA